MHNIYLCMHVMPAYSPIVYRVRRVNDARDGSPTIGGDNFTHFLNIDVELKA